MIRTVCTILFCTGAICNILYAQIAGSTLTTVGLYIYPPAPGKEIRYDFIKQCGYNYLEFCDGSFGLRPGLHKGYFDNMNKSIDEAHQRGMKVGILILSGTKQWQGPADVQSGWPPAISPKNKEAVKERLFYIEKAVAALNKADRFIFFAGDPGGDPNKTSDIYDFINIASEVKKIVNKTAPNSAFMINLWAIAEWENFPLCFVIDFWLQQVSLAKTVINNGQSLWPGTDVEFPIDNYYRSLALYCYDGEGIDNIELYPTSADIKSLHDRGTKDVWAWPYFLLDECDEEYLPNKLTTGQTQSETRYVKKLVDTARSIGLNGLVANATMGESVESEQINVFAFARMCNDPGLDPEQVINEYAGYIADSDTKNVLAEIIKYIENRSSWHTGLPKQHRVASLTCVYDKLKPKTVIKELIKVVPNKNPGLVLPEPPEKLLSRLKQRLEKM
jgi:hypothetical protein